MMLIIVEDANFVRFFNERVAEDVASDPHDLNLEVEGTILWHTKRLDCSFPYPSVCLYCNNNTTCKQASLHQATAAQI